jgi:hypothetical protein
MEASLFLNEIVSRSYSGPKNIKKGTIHAKAQRPPRKSNHLFFKNLCVLCVSLRSAYCWLREKLLFRPF